MGAGVIAIGLGLTDKLPWGLNWLTTNEWEKPGFDLHINLTIYSSPTWGKNPQVASPGETVQSKFKE